MIKARAQLDDLMGQMSSLADPTRLRLLRLLERHELGVTELCDVLQLPQSTISRHLKLLTDRGWTTRRRHGAAGLYSMTLDELAPHAQQLWQLAREQTQDWATPQQDRLRLDRCLQARKEGSQTFFKQVASRWDTMRDELYGPVLMHEAVTALLPRHWVVADLGCGTGTLLVELANHVQRVIGIDQSAEMLHAAGRRTQSLNHVELHRGSLEAIPLDAAACDAAILMLVLTYVPNPLAVLREASRILRPGGRFVMIDLLPHDREDFKRQMGQQWMGFEPTMLEGMLCDAGLTQPRTRSLTPQPNVKGPALMLATATRPGTE